LAVVPVSDTRATAAGVEWDYWSKQGLPTPPEHVELMVAALDRMKKENGDLRADTERYRPLWSSPFGPDASRWIKEPIPFPRPYISTHEAMEEYAGAIRCSSNWSAEQRWESMDKALHRVPDLVYEVTHLRADVDTLRREQPKPATILIAHPLSEIDEFIDTACDLNFWDRTDWENTGTELLHLPSNVSLSPMDDYLTEEQYVMPGDES
jgi:hypothetical protein